MTSVNSHLYLDPEQHDLLLAALASNPMHRAENETNTTSPMFLSDPAMLYTHILNDPNNHGNSSKIDQNQQPQPPASEKSVSDMGSSSIADFTSALNNMNSVSPLGDGLDYQFDLDGSYDYDLGMVEDYGSVDDSIDTPTTEHEKRKTPPSESGDGSPSSGARENEPKRRGWSSLIFL